LHYSARAPILGSKRGFHKKDGKGGKMEFTKVRTGKSPIFVAGGEDRFHDPMMFPRCKLSGRDTNGAICVLGGDQDNLFRAAVPLHVHHDQDEFWFIVEGEYLFQVGDQKIWAKTGDAVFGPRGVPHSPRQMSERGSLVSILQPAGTIEDFFRELGQLRHTEGGMPQDERLANVFRKHGMEIVGPIVEP
jgi:mannose-6-phosphate isomerase-like protein (cupin superfamily)